MEKSTRANRTLARRCQHLGRSAIRELFKAAADPEIRSLAGGVPDPSSLPLAALEKIHPHIAKTFGTALLQYGITEGFQPLRQQLSSYLERKQLSVPWEAICISCGAQSAIDAAAKVLIDPGDIVALEAPTFLASIKTFRSYEAQFELIETDQQGVKPESLERILASRSVRLVYLIPTFQNPAGTTLSLERRHAVAALLKKYDTYAIEDDPYYELRYTGADLPPLYSLAPEHVIYVGSLSKVFSPGMRLGYYFGPAQVSEAMTSTRQGVDVHANNYAQAAASVFLTEEFFPQHLAAARNLYRLRLEKMHAEIGQHFPKSFICHKPEGGMFLWIEGPAGYDVDSWYTRALERKVAFVPGRHFYALPGLGHNTARLNFTNVPEETIAEAIQILADVI